MIKKSQPCEDGGGGGWKNGKSIPAKLVQVGVSLSVNMSLKP